jgi:hypothetical protein
MRKMLFAVLLLSIVLVPALASAGAPGVGKYKTLYGQLLPGKATESMVADMAEGQLGNMILAESWDGVTLGTEWKIMCPQIMSAPVLLYDGGDNGQRIWQTAYGGGTMWLSGAGAWAGGDVDYTADLSSFSTTVVKQYVGGVLQGADVNINLTGVFRGYTNCLDLAIANAELVGATPGHFPPALGVFPPFYGPSDCSVTGGSRTTSR